MNATQPRYAVNATSLPHNTVWQDIDDIAATGAEGIGLWERKLPDGADARVAARLKDAGLAATFCVPALHCVLPSQVDPPGALVNGFSELDADGAVTYYDTDVHRPFWAQLEALDVPFYLHPRNPLPRDARIYAGHEWLLGPTWGFGQETAVHALRLMGSGVFDAHPGLRIVLGHMGEGLPYNLWRVDNHNAWIERSTSPYPARRRIADYFSENFYITTSGNFHTQTLVDAVLELGADRIMFSTDWPFENVDHAANWFDSAPISEHDRRKIGRDNALALFRLDS